MAISQAEFVNTVVQNTPWNPPVSTTGMLIHLESDPDGTGVSTILGLAVYPQGNDQSIDLTRVLEQVETVRFKLPDPFPGGSGEVNVALPVLNRAKYVDVSPKIFFYLQTPATQIQVELSEAIKSGVIVSFEPFIPDLLFTNNEYNALINSVNDQRESSYRQVADDNQPYFNTISEKFLPLPANLDLLIQGTATEAQIPDSNYTKRGWVQARYEGSTTGDLEFGGIPGFLTGRSFVGSSHVLDLSTGNICSLVQSERVLQDLFHTGPNTLPEILEDQTFLIEMGTQLLQGANEIGSVKAVEGSVIKNNLAKLKLQGNADIEIIRLISYSRSLNRLFIERGVNGVILGQGTIEYIRPIRRTQIFRLDKNRVVALSDVQVWIRDNPKVLRVDKFGIAFEEVACPEVIL